MIHLIFYIVEYVAIGNFYEFTICFLELRYFIRILIKYLVF